MTTTVRQLDADDVDALDRLRREAFGEFDPPTPPVPLIAPGKTWWGVEVDDVLVATALDREQSTWFGGTAVPSCGVSGVTVAPEHRGSGLLEPLMDALLGGARERGAVIAALFATSPGIYRRHGFEVITTLDDVRVPTAALAVGGSTAVRRGVDDDTEAVRAVHERWAREQNGPLSHSGPLFTEPPGLRCTGVTVAERAGTITGYVTWDRGRGYGAEARLRIWDLCADDEDSLRSLLSVMSSFASVTPTTVLRTSGIDDWRRLVRTSHAEVSSSDPYSLAVLDVRAFDRLSYPSATDARLEFRVDGTGYVLRVREGRGEVQHAETGSSRELTSRGLALAFAGAESSANLRRLRLLSGDDADDTTWDHLLGGRQVHVRDYF